MIDQIFGIPLYKSSINSNSYDMDINSDISENSDNDDFDNDSSNTNMVINIPQQNIITYQCEEK